MDHDAAHLLVADLLQGTRDPARRDEVARHVDGCAECQAWRDTYLLLARSLAADPAGGHPDAGALAEYALHPFGLADPERAAVEAHLERCGECRRHADLARRAVHEAPVQPAAGTWARVRPYAIAASLLVFVGSATVFFFQAQTLRQELDALRGWSGPIGYVVLQDAQRGSEETPRLTLQPRQPYGLLAVRLDLPADASGDDRVVFELVGGDGRVAWTTSTSAEDTRENVATFGALLLPVPRRVASNGRYEFVVSLERRGRRTPILQRPLQVEVVN